MRLRDMRLKTGMNGQSSSKFIFNLLLVGVRELVADTGAGNITGEIKKLGAVPYFSLDGHRPETPNTFTKKFIDKLLCRLHTSIITSVWEGAISPTE